MIVEFDIFQGEIEIGQLESPAIQQTVKWFIDKYEPVFLREQLGGKLADELIDGLSQLPVAEKWETLAGWLKFPAAEFIYCKYMRDKGVETAGEGVVKTMVETAKKASPWDDKIIKAWNEMIDYMTYLNCKIINSGDYPDYCREKRYKKINTFGL
jgi:hypothetical protein